MADEHTFTLTIEASGEVTPATQHPEAEQGPYEEDLTDG